MPHIQQTERSQKIIQKAFEYCTDRRHEFMTPEHLLYALCDDPTFYAICGSYGDPDTLSVLVGQKLDEMETVPQEQDYHPMTSVQTNELLEDAYKQVYYSSSAAIDTPHLVMALLRLEESWASYLLKQTLDGNEQNFMSDLIGAYEAKDTVETEGHHEAWRKLVTCMNDHVGRHNPLVGREAELERTIQVLCRKDKNNPLHVGEPGVGKTALVWGLAQRIEDGTVPQRLQHSRVYQLDLGTLLAGTQYRGDFENRIKQVMDGVAQESANNIVYIDEIHNLVGAGAVGESSMDASNMLKPYLEAGDIRFIGSTTYEEYNKHFSRSKGLVRRFQQIDIAEPSTAETIHILKQLRPKYEAFHGVIYEDEALSFAVEASAKYVNDRFLPDKAIDLMDEAGASLECTTEEAAANNVEAASAPAVSHLATADGLPTTAIPRVVTRQLIADVLAKTCKVDTLAMKDDHEQLASLGERLSAQIYGQDEAIRQVVEAIQLSKAGLLDDNKPLASLLFVGPTGVGKTEVARVLARELGIELVRFDMSEYTEKHTVAKLIGSPAGYVGYDDGGLLTDAIRKTPNCVLLLDEIEKAHQDIYNILLQVMDYARLTDNKGRKADFRNVVLIMTSNAGAQYAGQAAIGFQGRVSKGEAMLKQVKKTFKPEFMNRLSGTVVFNDMDRHMATLILKKKLRELETKLSARHVSMALADDAFALLLDKGFTQEYGAREMDRVINHLLKPLLMRELLFGSLQQGGTAEVRLEDGCLACRARRQEQP